MSATAAAQCAAPLVITGASGFVGRALMAHWGPSSRAMSLRDPSLDWHHTLAGAGTVVHLAARVHVMRESAGDPLEAFRQANVHASVRLARCAVEAGVKRMVFLSSVKVLGEHSAPGHPLNEADTPAPEDAYGQSKWEAELALDALARETGLELVIIRAPLVYGPGVKANFAALLRAVRAGWPLPLGAVDNRRSLLGLDNLVEFINLCCHHPAAANQTFLISDGKDISTAQLIGHMAQALGCPSRTFSVPMPWLRLAGRLLGRSAAVDRLCGNLQVDISKAEKLLAWTPSHSIDEGLQHAVSAL